ncbi:hypothetical protein ACIQUV_32410, partial [Streptomyces globosus]
EVLRRPGLRPAANFEPLGNWAYHSSSGEAALYNLDGPVFEFPLDAGRDYDLHIWRKGGNSAPARHQEMMGDVVPMEGLEEYLIQFCA